MINDTEILVKPELQEEQHITNKNFLSDIISANKKLFIMISLLFICFIPVYKFVLPTLINTDSIYNSAKASMNKGYSLDIKGLKAALSWDLALVLNAEDVKLYQSQKQIIHSEKSTLKIPLVMLLFKKFDNMQFFTNSADVYLERDINGIFNIRKAFKFKDSATKISKCRVVIKDYNITFIDKNEAPIVFNGYNLDLGNLKLYRLKTFGTIAFPDNTRAIINVNFVSKKPLDKGEFILKGNVDNLDLGKIEKYLIEINPNLTQASGLLNGDFNIDAYGREKITNNLKVSLNANNLFIRTKKYPHYFEISDDAQIFALGRYYGHKLHLKNFRLVSRDYNLECTGSIKDINKKNKKLDIKVRTKDCNIKKLLGVVPKTTNVKHDAVNKAIKYKIDGILDSNLVMKGDSEALKYYGTVKIKQFIVDGDITKSKSYTNLLYKRRKLSVDSCLVDKSGGTVLSKGISFMGNRPKIDFKISSEKFILNEMQKNLVAMSDLLGLDAGILPDFKLDGTAKTNLLIKGRGKSANTDGYLYINNAYVGHNKISKMVFVQNQNLEFKKRDILFKNFSSSMESHNTTLNGSISLDDKMDINLDAPNFPMQLALSLIETSPLLEELASALNFIESSDGNINSKINFSKDTFGKLKPKGCVTLLNNNFSLKDFSVPIANCSGDILFAAQNCDFKNITASALGSPISVIAKISNKSITANIIAPALDTNSVIRAISTSKALSSISPVFSDIKSASGRLSAILYLKGDSKDDIFDKLECHIVNNSLYLNNISAPIIIPSGSFEANKNEFKSNKILFNFLSAKGSIDGSVKNFGHNPDCNLKIIISNIDNKVFNSLKNSNLAPNFKKLLNNLTDFSGNASGNILIKKNITGKISFNNFGIKYIPASLPLNIKSGDLVLQDNKITMPNTQLHIGGSKFKINAVFNRNKTMGVELNGNLSPDDVDKYLNKIILSPFNLKKTTPVKLNLKKGSTGNWELLAGAILEPGNVISYKGFTIGDKSNSYLIGGKIIKTPSLIQFDNVGVHQLSSPVWSSFSLSNLLTHKNYFEISGWINQKNLEENLKIYARDFMDINLFNQFLEKKFASRIFYGGQFKGNLLLRGKIDSPKVTGYLDVQDAKIPYYKTTIKDLKIIFDNDFIRFQNGLFKIADSDLKIDAVADNLIDTPYVFKEMGISSDYVNVDEILKIFQDNSSGGLVGRPLFVVQKGVLTAKKLIVNNLITDDAKVDFSFTPDWVMTLDKFSFFTAGGEVLGDSTFDLLSKNSKTYMKFKNLKANAAATTLLQMPNEIYGLLNGEARFSTKGITRSDMVKNSNGDVKFHITSGRLVRMGSLEYLLMAAEVIKSGVTGLSINNICTLLSPKKTGYFDTINVNFKVKNGVLFTDDLVSRGENLSIYLAGNFDMTTNFSDFTILGRVSKSVVKILGPIGDLSINKVLNAIPGVDESISGKFSIPGVNLSDKDHRRFVVNIEGDLYNQKSVKNFKWID